MATTLIPYCVVLTHRHGACIGIVLSDTPSLIKSDFVETSRAYFEQKPNILQIKDNFEFFFEKNSFVCARVLGKTAENLANLFQFSCDVLNINTNLIKNFIVGIGPGSFTGLRLGCAFVNGIHLASIAKLFSIQTLLVNDLREKFSKDNDLIDTLTEDFGIYYQNDPSSGYVTFFDLFYAMHQIFQKKVHACDTLLPYYGKEPTPVLNLRKV